MTETKDWIIKAQEFLIKLLQNQLELHTRIMKEMLELMKKKCVRGAEYERLIRTAEEFTKKWGNEDEHGAD